MLSEGRREVFKVLRKHVHRLDDHLVPVDTAAFDHAADREPVGGTDDHEPSKAKHKSDTEPDSMQRVLGRNETRGPTVLHDHLQMRGRVRWVP